MAITKENGVVFCAKKKKKTGFCCIFVFFFVTLQPQIATRRQHNKDWVMV